MAVKLFQPASQVIRAIPRITKIYTTTHRSVLTIHPWIKNASFGEGFVPIHITRVAEQRFGSAGYNKEIEDNVTDNRTVSQIKEDLYQALQGTNRGIFGIKSEKKSEIHGLVELLESQNPTSDPTLNLDKVDGCWKLLYSTITILGSKRTKLGLRDFISLGDLFQNIDVSKKQIESLRVVDHANLSNSLLLQDLLLIDKFVTIYEMNDGVPFTKFGHLMVQKMEGKAVNVIKFNVRGLNLLNGRLTIEASFKISSKSRVDIQYDSSTITPDQLMNMFRKNYDLLLGIFNPEGWLDITYVDDNTRIGRDNKGNIFILERSV